MNQVTGELSNNGQPMRRFFQTFVLAPRSPTNYYVRNDIFRYQDEIFSDPEDEDEEDEVDEGLGKGDEEESSSKVKPEAIPESASAPLDAHQSAQPLQPINGVNIHPQPDRISHNNSLSGEESGTEQKVNEIVSTSSSLSEAPSSKLGQETQAVVPEVVPKSTWANIVNSHPTHAGSSNAFISSGPMPGVAVHTPQGHPLLIGSKTSPVVPESTSATGPGSTPGSKGKERGPRGGKDRRGGSQRASAEKALVPEAPVAADHHPNVDEVVSSHQDPLNQSPHSAVSQSRRNANKSSSYSPSLFGDVNQVFVGNLPTDITEDVLKKFFSKYGPIIDVRINRTNQAKGTGAGRTPNYGFVTFEDPRIVKTILNQKVDHFLTDFDESINPIV